jgi:hypothetical protein
MNGSLDPTFSLLHPTARLPEGWRPAFDAWLASCDRLERCEYLLAVEAKWFIQSYAHSPFRFRTVLNTGRPCAVDAWNTAAKQSRGQVLICASDDVFPCPHWDTLLLNAIGDLSKEAVLWVDMRDDNPDLITHPILTRAYYERPGRGGCPHGELFYPEYLSVGLDDDFTAYARRDGVVIDARGDIRFEHRNVVSRKPPDDEVYRHVGSRAAWETKARVLARRLEEGFVK